MRKFIATLCLIFAVAGIGRANAASLNFTGYLAENLVDTTNTFGSDASAEAGTPVYIAFQFDTVNNGQLLNFYHTGVEAHAMHSTQLMEVHISIGDSFFAVPYENIASGDANFSDSTEDYRFLYGGCTDGVVGCYQHQLMVELNGQIGDANGSTGLFKFATSSTSILSTAPFVINGNMAMSLLLLDEVGNVTANVDARFKFTKVALGPDIPLPAALPMMLAGLSGLGMISRRQT